MHVRTLSLRVLLHCSERVYSRPYAEGSMRSHIDAYAASAADRPWGRSILMAARPWDHSIERAFSGLTVFNYPTRAERYKVAALNAANKFLR
jgi:hypothetical protein